MHHSAIARARKDVSKRKFKTMGDHKVFLSRIRKSLYYGKLPDTERFSLPVSEIAAEIFSKIKNGKSLDRLDIEEAAKLSRSACVSPCSLVLALLYLERLKTCNVDYLQRVAPSELFLVSMMIASKFLHDDGEEDEVFNDEWATSAGLDVKEVNRFEKDFLQAIGWEVFVSDSDFWTRLRELERDVALREGKRRGWFSYTDLDFILETLDLAYLAQTLISVSAVCLTSYTASVLTLIGSAFIVSQIPGNSISSSVSLLANSRISPVQPFTDESNSSLPASSVLDESETILSSLSSCSEYGLISSDTEPCNISKPIHATNKFHWNSYQQTWFPLDIMENGSDHNCLKNENEPNIVSILHKFHDSKVQNNGDYADTFIKWLLWVSAWLETTTVHEIRHSGYWPIEISASC